jgi:hypothetical protein
MGCKTIREQVVVPDGVAFSRLLLGQPFLDINNILWHKASDNQAITYDTKYVRTKQYIISHWPAYAVALPVEITEIRYKLG